MSLRRIFASLAFAGLFFLPVLAQQGENRKRIDYDADIIRSQQVADSSVVTFVGNVVFHHNGAVIQSDSAVRYNDDKMEFFGRVIINQGTTYVYGDRADYDGVINEARVYAPIIKMVDEDAVLHTFSFKFNTLDNIGTYAGGGTITQEDNLLESIRGYYYADEREFVCVEDVEIHNPDYELKSDSVRYNLDTEIATFWRNTYIWSKKGEILSANSGSYEHLTEIYYFTSDSYILTAEQEVWADSIDYFSIPEDAVLRGNIQLRDEEQMVMGFGDYGLYWGGLEDAVLTLDPQLMSFDPEQDTLYMRADTIFLYTRPYDFSFEPDESAGAVVDMGEELIGPRNLSGEQEEGDLSSDPGVTFMDGMNPEPGAGEEDEGEQLQTAPQEGEESHPGTEQGNADPPEGIQPGKAEPELPDKGKSRRESRRERRDAEKQPVTNVERGSHEGHDHDHDHEHGHYHSSEGHVSGDATTTTEGTSEPGTGQDENGSASPFTPLALPDSLSTGGELPLTGDTLLNISGIQAPIDTLFSAPGMEMPADSVSLAEGASMTESGELPQDSIQRIVIGHHNVRIWRVDFQAVCDSVTGFTKDSTMHMYVDPIIWNENNQISSDVVDIYTRNEQLDRAVFYGGTPMMVQELDSVHYNQVKGKVIEAFFRDNEIYRTDVNGNAETYYYMEDDEDGEIMGFLVAESADITFHFFDQQLDQIIYRGQPVYTIYPMDKILLEQELFLPGFMWAVDRRPALEDVFNHTVRPSRREEYEAMDTPLFPLTTFITNRKQALIESRQMVDRNDRLSPQTIEFLESIDY